MQHHDDYQLARRIQHQILTHHLGSGAIQVFAPSGDQIGAPNSPLALCGSAILASIGLPVFGVFDSDELWTIMGTNGIVSKHNCALETAILDDLTECHTPTSPNYQFSKGEHQYLELTTENGEKRHIWVRSGPVYYAVYNIVLMVIKMRKR